MRSDCMEGFTDLSTTGYLHEMQSCELCVTQGAVIFSVTCITVQPYVIHDPNMPVVNGGYSPLRHFWSLGDCTFSPEAIVRRHIYGH
jgi:hypothetical protein